MSFLKDYFWPFCWTILTECYVKHFRDFVVNELAVFFACHKQCINYSICTCMSHCKYLTVPTYFVCIVWLFQHRLHPVCVRENEWRQRLVKVPYALCYFPTSLRSPLQTIIFKCKIQHPFLSLIAYSSKGDKVNPFFVLLLSVH